MRAYQFAVLSFNKEVINFVKSADDDQRYINGQPDRPYSLMEGIGGDIILYSDLIYGDGKFPAYEI